MMKDLIAKVGGLSPKGKSWHNQSKVLHKMSLWKFIFPMEEPMHMHGGFYHEYMHNPWDIVCYAIMHYIMLEDHFQELY